jgi:hypothetical protein
MSVEFENNILKVKVALDKTVEKFLVEAGTVIKSQAIKNTSSDTSHTKNVWDYVVDTSENMVTIGNPLENAIWEEYGTGEYALEGRGKQIAWYVPVELCTGKKKPSFNGEVVVVYGKNKKAYYKTNGKKPKRMLHNAFHTKKSALIRRANQLMMEEFE